MMEAMEEIKTTDWENITEEDWFEARRRDILPRLIFSDTDGNFYHYVPKKIAKKEGW